MKLNDIIMYVSPNSYNRHHNLQIISYTINSKNAHRRILCALTKGIIPPCRIKTRLA